MKGARLSGLKTQEKPDNHLKWQSRAGGKVTFRIQASSKMCPVTVVVVCIKYQQFSGVFRIFYWRMLEEFVEVLYRFLEKSARPQQTAVKVTSSCCNCFIVHSGLDRIAGIPHSWTYQGFNQHSTQLWNVNALLLGCLRSNK